MKGPTSLNGTYDQVVFSQRAVDIIHDHDKSSPLYIYLAYHNVHDACISDRFSGGLNAPMETVDLYKTTVRDTWKVQAAMTTELDYGVSCAASISKVTGIKPTQSLPCLRFACGVCANNRFGAFTQVANVTGALKAAGLYQTSVLLFMSDNVRMNLLDLSSQARTSSALPHLRAEYSASNLRCCLNVSVRHRVQGGPLDHSNNWPLVSTMVLLC
jgi:hypothetical protein|eukprot:COSAG02_NODE_36_length_48934_cov_144.851029_2_plen_214_part_00